MKKAEGQWNYAVEYDPAAVRIEQMLKAVSDLGYRPSVHGPIKARGAGENVKVTVTGASLEQGKAGNIEVKLDPQEGKQLGDGTSISVTSTELGISSESSPQGKPRTVQVQVTPSGEAKPGDYELIVVVKQGQDEVRLRVPVTVR